MMSRLSAFFGRTTAHEEAALPRADTASQAPLDDAGLESLGSRIGAENEGLRGMLVETSRKFEELDALKSMFGNIVSPVSDLLREVEQEKSQNAGLRNLLADVRGHLDTARTAQAQTERERAALQQDNASLRHQLTAVQQEAQGLETLRAELSNEVATQRGRIGQIERQLSAETSQHQALTDAHRQLNDQFQIADKKNVRLDSEMRGLQEKLVLAGEERQSLQASLDQAIAETARVTRRLSETESLLAAARGKIAEFETAAAESETARNALQLRFDETGEQHQTELAALSNRLGSVQSRAGASEKLLAETRQALAERTEEARDWERKATDAEAGRTAAEKKLAQTGTTNEALEQQIAELTQSRATLMERSGSAGKTLKLRETALVRAEEKIALITERLKQSDSNHQAAREAAEKRIEELSAALNRERMARAVAEGALNASRRDFARVQQEIADAGAAKMASSGATPTPAALAKRVKSNFGKSAAPAATAADTPPETAPKGRNGRKSAGEQATKS
jgi:chromosome segregation ATPase